EHLAELRSIRPQGAGWQRLSGRTSGGPRHSRRGVRRGRRHEGAAIDGDESVARAVAGGQSRLHRRVRRRVEGGHPLFGCCHALNEVMLNNVSWPHFSTRPPFPFGYSCFGNRDVETSF